MDNLEYIDDYFKGSPTAEEKQRFEQRIISDISFAEEVAFYISANTALQEQLQQEKKERFREMYDQRQVIPMNTRSPLRKIVRYLAAACVVAIAFLSVWVINGQKMSPQELASQFSKEKWKTIANTMGVAQENMQAGIELYNAGQYREALQKFDIVLKNDSASSLAKEYAGKSAFQLNEYDAALQYFARLANDSLEHNPGKFSEAVTLLKRNGTGDLEKAKALLQEVVVSSSLDGKKQAQEWLEKLGSIK